MDGVEPDKIITIDWDSIEKERDRLLPDKCLLCKGRVKYEFDVATESFHYFCRNCNKSCTFSGGMIDDALKGKDLRWLWE